MNPQLPPIDGRMDRLTPEGIVLSLLPAGPAIRMVAFLIDLMIIATMITLFVVSLSGSEAGQGVMLLGLFVIWWGYPMAWESFGGRTPGKRILGLRVLRVDGQPITWKEAFLRGLVLAADFLPGFYVTGLLTTLFVPGFRRLGDLAAGTVVVRDEKKSFHLPASEIETESSPVPLQPQEQRALIDLLERSEFMSFERRDELGDIASAYTGLKGKASVARLRAIAAGLLR